MISAGIHHYLEAICYSQERFRSLKEIRFATDLRGNPDFRAGNKAFIFKASLSGKPVSVKCFTQADEKRAGRYRKVAKQLRTSAGRYLTEFRYMENEIYLFDDYGRGSFLPVLLAEWVEGVSLGRWLDEKCRAKNRDALLKMAGRFAELGEWLLGQPWAHGDLKPDNIVIADSGQIRLIDYDSVFVPELAGESAPELGTPGFQHPLRGPKLYDRNLDDYSVALISTALYALAEFPEWYDEQDDEYLLFDPSRAVAGTCQRLVHLRDHWISAGQTALYRLASSLGSPAPEIPDLPEILKGIRSSGQTKPPGKIRKALPVPYYKHGFYGYESPQGEKITEAVYNNGESFSEGLALVQTGRKLFYIAPDGIQRIDASRYNRADSFSGQRAAVRSGRKWGYIAPDGSVAILPRFKDRRPFREGLAAVETEEGWGYIDSEGRFTIPPAFDCAWDFREGIAVAGINGKFGYIDREGRWLIPPRYDFASGFRNGNATAETNGITIRLMIRKKEIAEMPIQV